MWTNRKNLPINVPTLKAHKALYALLTHPTALPPIPQLDEPWQTAARTHSSFHAANVHTIFEAERNDHLLDYERLEHLGDSIMNRSVASLIHTTYPRLTVFERSSLMGALISNETISHLSLAYGLPSTLLASPDQTHLFRQNVKIQADLFEAFIGGLFKQSGGKRTTGWVQEVFRPLVEAGYADRKELRVNSALREMGRKRRMEEQERATEAGSEEAKRARRDHISLMEMWKNSERRKVDYVMKSATEGVLLVDHVQRAHVQGAPGDKLKLIKDRLAEQALIDLGVLDDSSK